MKEETNLINPKNYRYSEPVPKSNTVPKLHRQSDKENIEKKNKINTDEINVSFSNIESKLRSSSGVQNMSFIKETHSQVVPSNKRYSLGVEKIGEVEQSINKRSQSDANERPSESLVRKNPETLGSKSLDSRTELMSGQANDKLDNLLSYSKAPSIKKRENLLQE